MTWRTALSGAELFGSGPQQTIERAIWGDSTSGRSGPTQSQVLIELDVILAQKVKAVESNPADLESRTHIDVLHQVCNAADLLSSRFVLTYTTSASSYGLNDNYGVWRSKCHTGSTA